jgi:hypothetical protein
MQCRINFSSFLKIEKFCPGVEQYMLMQNPRFLPLSPLHRTAITTRELNYFPSKFFKTLLKNFGPVWHYLDRYEFPNSSCTYFLVWSKLTARVSNQLFFTIFQFTEKFAPVWNHTCRCRIRVSVSVPFALDRDSRSSVEPLFPSKFFKTAFEKFAPVCCQIQS